MSYLILMITVISSIFCGMCIAVNNVTNTVIFSIILIISSVTFYIKYYELEDKLLRNRQSTGYIYVLVGYEDICQNGNYECKVYGTYSSKELAKEVGNKLIKNTNVYYYEIEKTKLDDDIDD